MTSPVTGGLMADAWGRLKQNRAGLATAVILLVVAVTCLLGTLLSPHGYDQVHRAFIKVGPSLSPYPKAEQLEPTLTRALRRARVEIESWEIEGDDLTITVTSRRPIDDRITRHLDRVQIFRDAAVVERSPAGDRVTMIAAIDRVRFLFGTDSNGRDLFTRICVGGLISLSIGLLATFVSLIIGVLYGAVAGYLGGRTDEIMMRIVDILYALPFIFFVILLVVVFGRHFVLIFIAIGAIEWLDMARIVRGQTLSLKRREFVEAAQALGVDTVGILRRHIIPNSIGPILVYMTLMVPKVILLESFLSFLGLGIQEPLTSWGALISEGARNIQGAPWLLIFPSLFLTLSLFCLNFIGDGLRDAFDPTERS